MTNVVPIRKSYEAKQFAVAVGDVDVLISGTLCGHIDLAVPGGPTLCLSPDEAYILSATLLSAREDVLENSRPHDDPMLEPRR